MASGSARRCSRPPGSLRGFFYQLGGIRRPGVRVNVPLLRRRAFLPWTLLAIAICAQRAGTPAFLTDLVRDVLPDSALRRWSLSFPILAFTSGLLLAFALVEPRVRSHRGARDEIAEKPRSIHADEPVALAGPRPVDPRATVVRVQAGVAACGCSASTSSATACTRRRELRAARRSSLNAVAPSTPSRPISSPIARSIVTRLSSAIWS